MVQRRKAAKRKKGVVRRSKERLLFAFHHKDSASGVQRETVRRLATQMGISETTFLHLGAARLVEQLSAEGRVRKPSVEKTTGQAPTDDGRMSDAQIEAIRSKVSQDRIATSTFLDLLHDQD